MERVGPIVSLVGLLWVTAAAWQHGLRLLAVIAMASLTVAGAIASGEMAGEVLRWLTIGMRGLAVLLCVGSLLNLKHMWMPLALVVAGNVLSWKYGGLGAIPH